MTHMTDQQIEDAFTQVREKFEKTENEFGLEMLDNIEGRWEAIGELSDRQLGWLKQQLPGSRQRKPATVPAQPGQRSPIPAHEMFRRVTSEPEAKAVVIEPAVLDQLMEQVQALADLINQHRQG